MAAGTGIEWTEVTWNPTTGCDRISAGCDNCYALALAKRLKAMGQAKYQNDGDPRTSGPGFGLTVHPAALRQPYTWAGHRVVFVNSMSDLFHARVPLGLRPPGLRGDRRHPAAHLPGADQAVSTPAEDRRETGLAAEPVDGRIHRAPRHAVPGGSPAHRTSSRPVPVVRAAAGTTGGPGPGRDRLGDRRRRIRTGSPAARPGWVTTIRDACVSAAVPFFFKQWGGRTPKAGGRELDGQVWDEMPRRPRVSAA